jgi:DNA-binding MarR family transcriptional regulator
MDNRNLLFGTIFSLANALQAAGDSFLGEISAKQWFLLASVGLFPEGSPSVGEVTKIFGTSHQNVMQIALKLEEKGYLTISLDEKDRRVRRLTITQQTKAFWNKMDEPSAEFINRLFCGIGAKDLSVSLGVLSTMAENTRNMRKEMER